MGAAEGPMMRRGAISRASGQWAKQSEAWAWFGGYMPLSAARAMLNTYSAGNGVTMSFADNSLVIADPVTPANNYEGPLVNQGTGLFNKLTYTRASAATAVVNGILQTFSAGVPRIQKVSGVKAYLAEASSTNLALQCRDMTQAAWVKVNATVALTATGADNVANSATTITATAANATVLQTVTQVATQDVASFWLRRRTGASTVNITQDGTTWSAVTLTSSWQRFAIPAATLTNPIIGIQITTSGDAVDADYSQLEAGKFASSAILTTTAAATRAADALSLPSTICNMTTSATLYAKIDTSLQTLNSSSYSTVLTGYNAGQTDYAIMRFNGTTAAREVDGGVASVSQWTSTVGSSVGGYINSKWAMAWNTGNIGAYFNGAQDFTSLSGNAPTVTTVYIGSNAGAQPLNGVFLECMFAGQRIPNAQLQALTT